MLYGLTEDKRSHQQTWEFHYSKNHQFRQMFCWQIY